MPYDKCVIAVGSVSNPHGVPGLENAYSLKTVEDVLKIRRHIMDSFERASLPSTSSEERKRLLSFVVCGGGPTGVEFASEVRCVDNPAVAHPARSTTSSTRTSSTTHVETASLN